MTDNQSKKASTLPTYKRVYQMANLRNRRMSSLPMNSKLVLASLVLFILPATTLANTQSPSNNLNDTKISDNNGNYFNSDYLNNVSLANANYINANLSFINTPTTTNRAALPDLPDLGNGSNRFVEEREHKAIGEWSLRQLYSSAPLLVDPWIQEELNGLTWRLNAQVRTQAPLALVVIDNPNINAFAIPGGVIGINTGTVLAANSMGEVASVLAHEVAHLSQHHYEHRDEANTKALLLQMATMIAGAAAASVDSNAATAIMLGGQTAAQNSQMAFSRSNEREADRIGMQILAQSGFDPRAMPQFFATLNARNEINSSQKSFLPSFIMTHPLSSERLSEAQTRANSYTVNSGNEYPHSSITQASSQEQLFDLLKWRTAVISNQVQEASLSAASERSYGARLALATFYANKERFVSANNIMSSFEALPATKKQSFEPLLSITKAHIAGKQGKWQESVDLLQRQHVLYPERRDLRLYLADARLRLPIVDSNQTQAQLQRLLTPLIEQTPYDVEALTRMQVVYEKIANEQRTHIGENPASNNDILTTLSTINALRYRSQRELWQTDYDMAQKSLQQAKLLAIGLEGSSVNPKALLAKINVEIETLNRTKDFHP